MIRINNKQTMSHNANNSDTARADTYNSLCCSLLNSSQDVPKILQEFSRLTTNHDRVEFVYDLLTDYGLFLDAVGKFKCEKAAVELRQRGNEMFKVKNDMEALLRYTESIAHADLGSQELGLAYANRSAVLFEHKFYKECLQDISRAFSNNYPIHLHEKLLKRKQKAGSALSEQVNFNYHEEIPIVSHGPNNSIECASGCVEVKFARNLGRHVVATRDIQVGDVIAVEKPYAQILLKENYLTHCYHCLRPRYNLIPCDNCSLVLFCGEDCKRTSWHTYHKHECPILATLLDLGYDKLTLMALKICILAKDEYSQIGEPDKPEMLTHKSGNYREIHNLIPNTDLRSTKDLLERAVDAAAIFELLDKSTSFFADYGNEDGEKSERAVFKELLLLHMQTGPSNFHEISELDENRREMVEIGAGSYSFLSLLNHACCPNVVRHCYGNVIVLRALRPIPEGHQLFDNYGYHHAVMPKIERQSHLKQQYYFDCVCEACTENWPLYQELPLTDFDIAVSYEDITNLRNGNAQVARATLLNLPQVVQILEGSRPCRELSNAQEIIKRCHAIFAGKRQKF